MINEHHPLCDAPTSQPDGTLTVGADYFGGHSEDRRSRDDAAQLCLEPWPGCECCPESRLTVRSLQEFPDKQNYPASGRKQPTSQRPTC